MGPEGLTFCLKLLGSSDFLEKEHFSAPCPKRMTDSADHLLRCKLGTILHNLMGNTAELTYFGRDLEAMSFAPKLSRMDCGRILALPRQRSRRSGSGQW